MAIDSDMLLSYHNGAWALKSIGLPASGWRRIIADHFDPAHWLGWNDTAVYATTDGGAHWPPTADIFVGYGGYHYIQDATFSTTEPGVWYVVSRVYDSFMMNTFGA